MSRAHHKNLSRGIKQGLTTTVLRPRVARHGRVLVGNPPASFDDQRPSPFVKTWRTIKTGAKGELVVEHHSRPMTATEVEDTRNAVKRATGPTSTLGEKNVPEGMAPRGKMGSKSGPAQGGR